MATWQFGNLARNAELTFNFGNFQNWELSILATFNFGNFQLVTFKFWQRVVGRFLIEVVQPKFSVPGKKGSQELPLRAKFKLWLVEIAPELNKYFTDKFVWNNQYISGLLNHC